MLRFADMGEGGWCGHDRSDMLNIVANSPSLFLKYIFFTKSVAKQRIIIFNLHINLVFVLHTISSGTFFSWFMAGG